jgi:L-ascorbate metabolism protein UlaG (beta-lactamase superfamily)
VTRGARLTWLGHSTVVLELDGTRIVTDPVLARRVAHLWRSTAPPELNDRASAVLVSHLHWDHFHAPSLTRLAPGAVLLIPKGAERLVRRLGFREVVAMSAGEIVSIGQIEVEATHAEHPPSRRSFRRSEAIGYVLRGSHSVYFAGDTDLFDGMRELRGGLDVALLPVGGWGRTLPAGHLDARKAVLALELLRPRAAVPIHWGTFAPFGLARFGGSESAAEDFRREAATRVPATAVHVLPIGGSFVLGN